ncbi:MAG: alpha/beta hydrolase [Bryobacterales bacterium]|nr:alpha/beta hydrolase [Bryobacterales bacterium]
MKPLPIAMLVMGVVACSQLRRPPTALDKLKPCTSDEGPTDAYCGKLEVFENRASNTGRKIALKIVLLPGLSRNTTTDPLFYLAGGPGTGAAKMARNIKELFRDIQTERDIVLVDQRGTGDSAPLACKFDDDIAPGTAEETFFLNKLKKCLDDYKADVRQYTTSIAMDDLDEVRAYLGYSKINIYGGSYGTRAGIEYVRRHGGHVRSIVLDGVAPPDMKLPLYMARDGQRAMDLLIRDCEQDKACNERFPKLRDRVRRIFTRLQAKPEKIKLAHPRTGKEQEIEVKAPNIAAILFTAFYNSPATSLLPLLLERAENGDYRGLFALGTTSESISEMMSHGMHFSVVCAEDAPLVDNAEIAKETSGTFMGDAMAKLRLKPCEYWPRNPVDPAFYKPFASDVPALILSGEIDPVTPPVWGEQIARQWKNSKHLVVPGVGHGTVTSGCVMRIMTRFIKAGTFGAIDTSCLARVHRPPFFLGPAGPNPETPTATRAAGGAQ